METRTLRNLGLKRNSETQINYGDYEQWEKSSTMLFAPNFSHCCAVTITTQNWGWELLLGALVPALVMSSYLHLF